MLRLRGSLLVWEPLVPDKIRSWNGERVDWHQAVPPDTRWPRLEAYLDSVLHGSALRINRRLPRDHSVAKLIRAKRLVIKFCRVSRMLPWMVSRYPHLRPIHIIRHPCAVVASQLRHPEWQSSFSPRFEFLDGPYSGLYDAYQPLLQGKHTREEKLAVNWCLDHLFALRSHDPRTPGTVICAYEKLVTDGVSEVQRIANAVGIERPDVHEQRMKQPSSTTERGSPVLAGGNQLLGWRNELSNDQVKRILNIVCAFGLGDLYCEAPELDYRVLDRPESIA